MTIRAGVARWGRARPWAAALLVWLGAAAAPAVGQRAVPVARARVTDGARVRAACAECHRNADASHADALGHAPGATCLTCHHLGFTNDSATAFARREAACRACHKTIPPTHAGVGKAAPACESCHRLHGEPALPAAKAAISDRCRACHGRPHELHAVERARAPLCTDCHQAHGSTPIRATDARVTTACASCHKGVHPSHASVKGIAQCTSCHELDQPAVATGARLTRECQSCHRSQPAAHASVKTIGCTSCHGFGTDARLPRSEVAISRRCGSCHPDEMARYRQGAHAQGLAAGHPNRDLPNCVSCHDVHKGRAGEALGAVRVSATTRCIRCHSQGGVASRYGLPVSVGASYGRDFHGETVRFLAGERSSGARDSVMICSDCHGAHDVVRKRQASVAVVCVRCHGEGDARIASAWLGHTPVGPRSQPLIWLIHLFYYFLIPFELLGLAVHIFFQLRDQRRHGARPLETEKMKRLRGWLAGRREPRPATVTRFQLHERLEHVGAMVTFILLVVTGLPQIRPDLAPARDMIALFGGIQWTRYVHRTVGVIFVLLMIMHATRAVVGAVRKRRLPIMVPLRKDFLDALQTVKHYLLGAPRPKAAKFDASEKFEYWGLLLGGTLMCVTGLGLLFPELVTRFVPGLIVAAFRTLHGLEATFAVLVIVLWHTWGVILRPEVFPLDDSIFTGEITVERLKEEHGEEYERLFPEEQEQEQEQDDEVAVG